MKIILVEDDEYKAKQIEMFVHDLGHDIDIFKAYNTGMNAILKNVYKLALLDMTIPSFEISPEHPISRSRKYGGKDILNEMRRCGVKIPVIVITQYRVFDDGEKSLERLDEELLQEYAENYRGIVYYNSSILDWQDKLQSMMYEIER